ncbi:transporter [Roseomonas eburnea]|uniref:Transporter n=1 Tax=Neoroseomonas eburnea TaxID=1346889 RepID=A0A9X9X5N6_9PROT|nr:transporter [Neoroseomonas eburnea]MBR0679022.1 transporter [Neoroseomonas eburnea]
MATTGIRPGWPGAATLIAGALMLQPPGALAQGASADELRQLREMFERQQRQIQEQANQLSRQQRLIDTQAREIDGLRQAVGAPRRPPRPTAARPAGEDQAVVQPAPAPPPTGGPAAARDGQRPSTAAEAEAARRQEQQRVLATDPTLARVGGILTPRGSISLEPEINYLYSQNTVAAVNGFSIIPGITFGTVDIRRDIERATVAALTLRYGITDRLEVNARFPYVYRSSTIQTAPADITASPITVGPTGSGIGDIEFGASYQINAGQQDWPIFIANLRVKSDTGRSPFEVPIYTVNDPQGAFLRGLARELPTGTGFWSVEPGVTVAWATDPAVFFGGLRYIWNIGRTVDVQDPAGGPSTPTDLDPGDGIGMNFGVGFALNERTSLSLGYEQVWVFSSSAGGSRIAGSGLDIGSFNFGLSYRASERVSFNLGVQIGTTESAPAARLIFRVPIRFSL